MKKCYSEILERGKQYETPATKVVEILSEGILCGSAKQYGTGLDDLTETEYGW